tara:strand:+ start:844 stop:1251 length:408 start_codon:yes stop_codon:yes gene_type:complete
MIIQCINCHKKFEVNSSLIPSVGRLIQCGSCNHKWFYKPNIIEELKIETNTDNVSINENSKEIRNTYNQPKKNNISFSKLLYYLIVIIISFIALVIILDTFKYQLESIFPNLEFILFNLFETLKDIKLFIKNLLH